MNYQTLLPSERQLLWRKYVRLDFTAEEANKRINNFCTHLKNMKEKLEKQNKPEKEINEKFRKEFEKLCRELDV